MISPQCVCLVAQLAGLNVSDTKLFEVEIFELEFPGDKLLFTKFRCLLLCAGKCPQLREERF